MLTAAQNVELPLLLTKLRAEGAARARGDRAARSSGSPTAQRTIRAKCRADSSSAWPLRAPSSPIRSCSCATSRPAISTAPAADEILSILQLLNGDLGKTIVMVTHDPAAAKYAKPHAASRQGPLHREGACGVNDFVLIRKNLFRKNLRAILMIVSILDRLRDLRRARRLRTRLRRRRGSSPPPTG